ncbi:hypothetical protein DN545_33740, partial [Burkholderia multivorans]
MRISGEPTSGIDRLMRGTDLPVRPSLPSALVRTPRTRTSASADIELPTGERTRAYRFFEALPALISYT